MQDYDLQRILEDASWDEGENKLIITDVMRTASDRIYMTVNGMFDIQINKTDEGLVIDIFSTNPVHDADEVIGSTWVLDNDVLTDEELGEAHG